ncbi:unnamed protein product [Camellia sinensis]
MTISKLTRNGSNQIDGVKYAFGDLCFETLDLQQPILSDGAKFNCIVLAKVQDETFIMHDVKDKLCFVPLNVVRNLQITTI